MTGFHPFRRLARLIARARIMARDREAMALLGDRDFHDMGISRATLTYELNKPIWRD